LVEQNYLELYLFFDSERAFYSIEKLMVEQGKLLLKKPHSTPTCSEKEHWFRKIYTAISAFINLTSCHKNRLKFAT